MPFRPLPLPPSVSGRLWLYSMPGRLEPWSDFEQLAQAAGLTRIVCLTPWSELLYFAPAYAAAVEAGPPWVWQALPMADFGLHAQAKTYREGVATVVRALQAGESVLLHCAAGIGRTGTTAACVLKSLGLSSEAACAQVSAAGSNPQSALQSGWIEAF
ncbi:protein-tyrosine phosphatase family protein [Inhella gelatinilytica]|uniref:Tyrosine-protein phosphatase n=1 Tax=Inhella gelatinilytica TaxID=2795030 RepID=A0A931IWI1_9BURK|nr:tyrosine-protein phosphatase [Inhella gelatinilytica]MBH9552851.1 tyrosine-protein phosphatase [Inhella gelatinilytica]